MSRSRPASNPLSYHKPTGQYYVTRGKRRRYLGANRDEALVRVMLQTELDIPSTVAAVGAFACRPLADGWWGHSRSDLRG